MSKLLGLLVAAVLVTLAFVFFDDDDPVIEAGPAPTSIESETDVPKPLTVKAAPEVVETTSEAVTAEPTPVLEEAHKTGSPWTVRWTLADEVGDALEYTELTRLGVFEAMLPTAHLTVTDNAGVDESEIELQDFRAKGSFSTTRRSPIDIVLRFGDFSFAGKAATEFSTVVLRATGSLEQSGFASVTFEANRRVNIVAAVDLESLVSRQIIASPESRGPLTAPFAPGRYSFMAEGTPDFDRQRPPGRLPRTHGAFVVEGPSPQTVRLDFHDVVTLSGTLQPPPAPGEKVAVKPIARGAWMFARHMAAVANDGTFTVEALSPGEYTWVIERAGSDGIRISTSASTTIVPENDSHATVVDAGVGAGGEITVLVRGTRALINVFTADGTLCMRSGPPPERATTVTMPRGIYTYIVNSTAQGEPVAQRGTFTIGAEPIDLTFDFTDG